ncbi:MAG: hypothetical protein JWP42_639 [Pseudomonas sp.]|nr:hypothetical protein [Pseudomonas sp.]
MNRFMEILVSTSCVLSLLILSACEQSETPKKSAVGSDKTVAGTWFEGEWISQKKGPDSLPRFQITTDSLVFDGCTSSVQSLVSSDEQKASLVVKKGSGCSVSNLRPLTDIMLVRKAGCEMTAEFFASPEDIKQGVVQASAIYTKTNCKTSEVK